MTAGIDLARLEREDNAKKARLESATDAARSGNSKEMERMLDELWGPDGAAVVFFFFFSVLDLKNVCFFSPVIFTPTDQKLLIVGVKKVS